MRLTLTRRGWAMTLGAFVVWLGCLAAGLRDLWYLLALLLGLVAVSLAWLVALPLFSRFEASVSALDPTPTAGDRVAVTALVSHRLRATVPLWLRWRLPGEDRQTPLRVSAGRGAVVGTEYRARRRGPQRLGISGLTLFDPLGLAKRRVSVEAAAELLVLPAQIDSLARALDGVMALPGRYEQAAARGAANDTGAPSGAVRAWRSGDPLRRIHWKQSARQGELLVKLHDGADSPDRALLLVTAPEASLSGAEFEAAVSAAATLGVHWLRQGHPLLLHLGDEPAVRCETEGELLRRLALAGTGSPLDMGRAMPRVHAVVTGGVPRKLDAWLRLAPPGLLLTARIGLGAPGPWRQIPILERDAEARDG